MNRQQQYIRRPWCPFCGQEVERATDQAQRKMSEFDVGSCSCGAVYSCDPTGYNVGAALVETLVYACGDNAELAWELVPEDDYLTGRIEHYDEISHQVVDTGSLDGRAVRGVLYFVRLHTEVSDIAGRLKERKAREIEAVEQDHGFTPPSVEPLPDDNRVRQRADKRLVKELAAADDEDGLVALCLDDRKTLRLLQRLLYEPDEEQRWRTALLVGRVCARVATRDPGQVSELLHRLFGACSDSAATPWGMLETIGAVIAARPDIFGAFTQYLLNYVGADSTRVQALWALAEIGARRPDLVRNLQFYALFQFIGHPQAEVRGQVARLLGRIRAAEASMQLMGLHSDTAELVVWEDGTPVRTTVAAQAKQAVKMIQEQP